MTQLHRIAAAMGGEVSGNRAIFPTPGHSPKDRGSWASIVPDAPDGVLIHSQNGGDPLAIKDELRAKGVLPTFEPRGNAWRVTGTYEYADANGAIVYRTVRKEKPGERKKFMAERLEGGRWVSGLGDVERIVYRLPDIHKAINTAVLADKPMPTIYFVEGERKADKLASWGLLATAVAFGCKGWRNSYADALAGCNVIILPDNDEPGREFADRVSHDLVAAGSKVSIVNLPGLAPKGDIIDWSGTREDLEALCAADANKPDETFETADLALWANTPPTPKAFVMAPFIPRDDVVIVTGDGGTNKSTAALQISACAAAGKQMLGMDVAPSPALYVTAEDDQRENHWRLTKIAASIGTTLHELAGRLHVVSLRGRLNNELATFDHDGKLRTAPAYALLRATIVATRAKLVTLDNVAHLFAGNENDRGQVTAFINLLYQLCGDLGVTILLIAHRNKNGDSYSGSTAWLNAVRSQVLLERSDEHDPDARRMSLGKANYARAGEEVSFRWYDFALIRDADLPADVGKELATTIRANADNACFLACLAERNSQRRQVSEKPTAANFAPKQFVGMPQAKGLSRKRLEDALDRLYRIGAIERGFLYRDTGEGKDIHGLREATGAQPETSPETSRKVLPETSGDPQKTTGNTPPIYKYMSGAPLGAAPVHEKEGKPDLSQPVFKAEPVEFPADDDDNPAWDDEPYRGRT